jgi:acetyl-CoA carboxylase carboxyl transferase subunit alpha
VGDRAENGKGALDPILPFERHLLELEHRIAGSNSEEERTGLQRQLQKERDSVYPNLNAWERVQLARHGLRPRMLDYTSRIFDDVIELHGDRAIGDDPAVVTGIARFQGQTVMIAGQQKGISTDEKVARNFGMAHPEGYRKARRMYQLAERFGFPIVTFVDTPAAHPGVEAEQHGQGPAIAESIMTGLCTRAPILSVVLGEGGSGGALAIAVSDRTAMFEHAIYVICPPERCAEILWRNVEQKEMAASALRLTAKDLLDLGVIDNVLPEPGGGAHRNPDAAAQVLAEEIERFLRVCKEGRWSVERRQDRYRRMGVWYEEMMNAREAAD